MLREAELYMFFFFFLILPLHVLTFHFFFDTGNFQTWRGDNYLPGEQFFDTVCQLLLTYFELKTKNTDTGNDT